MSENYLAGRLFANPSVIEGVSRLVDLGTTLQEYNDHKTEEEADVDALKRDWEAVGDDLKLSIKNYEQEKTKKI